MLNGLNHLFLLVKAKLIDLLIEVQTGERFAVLKFAPFDQWLKTWAAKSKDEFEQWSKLEVADIL